MRSLEDIKNILNGHKKELQTKFRVKNIGVFGSYVRGENKRDSDLDLLVEFEEPVGLFVFMDLEDYIEDLVHTKIDLVSAKALKPRIGKKVFKEVVYI